MPHDRSVLVSRPGLTRWGLPLAVLLVAGGLTEQVRSEELPADRPIPQVIDHYVQARLDAESVSPVAAAPDANWLRRVTLDLAGRIPSVHEVNGYLADQSPTRRATAIDRLLNSPDFAYHERNVLDTMLLAELGNDKEWRTWLLNGIRDGRPWDQMFRDMMTGSEENPEQKPALTFLRKRAKSQDEMTNDTSRLFFGVSINCAQCHDHPLVSDWLQDHYFGFQSFFARTYLTKANRLAEKPSGEVKFKTTEGEEKLAQLMFLNGTVIPEPPRKQTAEQKKKEDEEVQLQVKDANAPPPRPPAFSPRKKLVETALSAAGRELFAGSIVNRVWGRFFGRGLVHPLDQMHSENPSTHPELLDWLTQDLIRNRYNLRRLVRGIVLSDTYARSSQWTTDEAPDPELYAVAVPRPLTPRQYALSLILATTHPDELQRWQDAAAWPRRRRELEDRTDSYLSSFETPTEHFMVSVDEALLFSNGDRIRNDFLRSGNDRLLGQLTRIEEARGVIEAAFQSILSRSPTEDELAAFEGYLSARSDRREDGIRQAVWALLTSPELRFNY